MKAMKPMSLQSNTTCKQFQLIDIKTQYDKAGDLI